MTGEGESGVDLDLGNRCAAIAYAWAKKTFKNRPEGEGRPVSGLDGAFSNVVQIGDRKLGFCSDGIGTKIELAERMGIYHTLGFDLVAMVVDDLAANGLEPVSISNVLDVDFLDSEIVDKLMRGLHDAAQTAEIVVTGGEIAELGERIRGFGDRMHFNWCATAVGVIPTGREPIDGRAVSLGDTIIALQSRGFRSNGYSLLRRIMAEAFGPDWHATPFANETSWGELLLESSRIFAPGIVELFRAGFGIHGIAHITGGGICDNLARVLAPTGLGGLLTDLYPPLDVMKRVQILGNIDDATAYRFWNMGTGMLLIVDASDTSDIIAHLAEDSYAAKLAGEVTPEPTIELRTMGFEPTTLSIPEQLGKSV